MIINNLQVLRAIAAYMVLIAHIEDVEQKYGQGRLLGAWTKFGDWGVDLFFVLSGFVIVMVTQDVKGSLNDAARFLWSRATRIYPLWWLCLSAIVLTWLIMPEYVYGGDQLEIDLVKDYLLIPNTESPLLQTGWTLIHEMYFYCVFAALLLLPLGERRRLQMVALWGILAITAGLLLRPDKGDSALLALMTHPMTLEFVAGAFCALVWKTSRGAFGPAALIAGVAALALGLSLYVDGSFGDPVNGVLPPEWARVVLFLPSAALITYGAASVELRQGWTAKGLPVRLGDWSYSLYLTHMMSLNFFGLIWARFAMPGLIDNVFALAIITFMSTLVAALCFKLFEQPLIRNARETGGRLFQRTPALAQQNGAP